MRVLVSGASGLVGGALVPALREAGHEVARLVRRTPLGPDEAGWAPDQGVVDAAAIEHADAVIHLSGENLAKGRWTDRRKARIHGSRVESTKVLAEAIARADNPPRTWLCASAVGYYGDCDDRPVTEDDGPGGDFLARLCVDWEAAAAPAAERGARVVNLRFGVVLAREGGMLALLLPLFRCGLGGTVGGGGQYMSWVALPDAVRAMLHALDTETLQGPVNIVSMHAVTNREFTHALARTLHRPALAPAPAFAVRLALGREMADAVALASIRAVPERLEQTGFRFQHADIGNALAAILQV